MTPRRCRSLCRALPAATSDFPFGPDVEAFRVGGKIFALLFAGTPPSVNLKCEPAYALELRSQFPDGVRPGYHMNKRHWNTVALDAGLPDEEVEDMILHSYERVVAGLPRRVREAMRQRGAP